MTKKIISIITTIILVMNLTVICISADTPFEITWRTNTQITRDGAIYTLYNGTYATKDDSLAEIAHSVTVKPSDKISIDVTSGNTVYGRSTLSSKLAKYKTDEDTKVIAAINGDFFSGMTGLPLGVQIQNGRVMATNNSAYDKQTGRTSIGFTEDGSAVVGVPEMTIKVTVGKSEAYPQRLNSYPYANFVMLDSSYSSKTYWSEGAHDVLVIKAEGELKIGQTLKGTFEEYRTNVTEPVEIKKDCYYLIEPSVMGVKYLPALAKDKEQGDKATVVIKESTGKWKDVVCAMGGGDMLVKKGKVTKASGYDSDISSRLTSRSAIGIKKDGSVVIYAVERDKDGKLSAGVPMSSLALAMKDLGCETAVNLDGGGSTTFAVAGENTEAKTVNSPQDGSERLVSNILVIRHTEAAPVILEDFEQTENPQSDEQKPDEQKPDEQKPDEQKPDEQKPDEQKPEESKPVETQKTDSLEDTDNKKKSEDKDDTEDIEDEEIEQEPKPEFIEKYTGQNLITAQKVQGGGYTGSGELQLDYKLAKKGSVSVEFGQPIGVADYKHISVAVKGDASGNLLEAVFDSAYGELKQTICKIDFEGYKHISFDAEVARELKGFAISSDKKSAGKISIDRIVGSRHFSLEDDIAPTIETQAAKTVYKITATDGADGTGVDGQGAEVITNGQLQEHKYKDGVITVSTKKLPKDKISLAVTEVCDSVGNRARDISLIKYYKDKTKMAFADASAKSWDGNYIRYCYENEYISGIPEGENLLFKGTNNITRTEFCVMLVSRLGIDVNKYSGVKLPYADKGEIPDWAILYVKAAYKEKIMIGGGDSFNPFANITRAEAAVASCNIADVDPRLSWNKTYADSKAIPDWAIDTVSVATAQRIFNGNEKGEFNPAGLLTRSEAAVIMTQIVTKKTDK